MQRVKTKNIYLSIFLISIWLFVLIFVITHWSTNQWITYEMVEEKLAYNMSPAQAEEALSLPHGYLTSQTSLDQKGDGSVLVATNGIGSMFSHQHEIFLIFNNRKLTEAGGKDIYIMDEPGHPVTLKNTLK